MKQTLLLRSVCAVLLSVIAVHQSFSQSAKAPKYVSIAYIRSKSPDFLKVEKEQWVPVHQALIKQEKKTGWYLYRVKYPAGTQTKYDYVCFNIFSDWKQAEAPYSDLADAVRKIHPGMTYDELTANSSTSREIVWEQLHQVIDEAVTTNVPSQYIIVNEVLTVAGAEREYVTMELNYFKPFHAERVNQGLMSNWSLYKPALPYGTNYDHDYVTLNGFKTWDDIIKNPPSGLWKKVHGDVAFDSVHTKILQQRNTVNNELWELVAYATE